MNWKRKKVVRMKSHINLNMGIVILGIVFVYFFTNTVMFFTMKKTSYYEVVEGSNAEDVKTSYLGIALRDEIVQLAKSSGYIDYYISECSRVSKNTTLYSIDSKGSLSHLLSEATENDTKLNSDNLSALYTLMNDFSNEYTHMDFKNVYSFKAALKGTMMDLVNINKLQKIAREKGETFTINKSASSGIVVYSVDGYESLTPNALKTSEFDCSNYTNVQFTSGMKVEKNNPIYKTIHNEEWSIAIPFSGKQVKKYKNTQGIKIKFLKDDVTTTANLQIVKGADKKHYGIITLSKYLIRYITDRFLRIQIIDDTSTGLKIPKTALVKKNLYVIPKEYGAEGGDSNSVGFNRQKYTDGNSHLEFYYPAIADSDEHYYYVSESLFQRGDVLLPLTSYESPYVIGKTQEFVGVYGINNGYTVFIHINILETLDEYYIVEAGNPFGLSQYDRIVLDGSQVAENQIIFQ